jgi:hypothetical protein
LKRVPSGCRSTDSVGLTHLNMINSNAGAAAPGFSLMDGLACDTSCKTRLDDEGIEQLPDRAQSLAAVLCHYLNESHSLITKTHYLAVKKSFDLDQGFAEDGAIANSGSQL